MTNIERLNYIKDRITSLKAEIEIEGVLIECDYCNYKNLVIDKDNEYCPECLCDYVE